MRKLLAVFSLAMIFGCGTAAPVEDTKAAPEPAAVEEPTTAPAEEASPVEAPETTPESDDAATATTE